MEAPITLRPYKADLDESFVYKSWIEGYRQSPFAVRIPKTPYCKAQKQIIDTLLNRSDCMIACNPEDHEHIYGYIVGEQKDSQFILHWAYVKQPYRGMEIFRRLLKHIWQDGEGYYSHYNVFSESVLGRFDMKYLPYLSFRRKRNAKRPKEYEPKRQWLHSI